MVEMPAMNKHSSLLYLFVGYTENKVLWIRLLEPSPNFDLFALGRWTKLFFVEFTLLINKLKWLLMTNIYWLV